MRDDPFFQLDLVACDMHLDERFGHTIREIEEDFEVSSLATVPASRPRELGYLASSIARHLEVNKPDLLMLYGDRGESLAAALVATELCIPIAHLQGGDLSGTMDNRRRRAISQLSDIHFVSNTASCTRVKYHLGRMGNVHVVGDSHLDPIYDGDFDTMDQVCKDLNLMRDFPIVIVLHHPDPTDSVDGYRYIQNIMDAIVGHRRQFVMIYPCSDPGWERCVQALKYFEVLGSVQIHKNLPSRQFLGLMNIASCIIGNSSCGIIEAPYADLACVNVGNRQKGRLCSNNVIHAGAGVDEIRTAFELALKLKPPFDKLYGNGATGKRIVNILNEWKHV